MSFDSSIIAHFGGDTTDLKSSTDEASIMMKGFSSTASRAVREIGQGFVGAVVFMEAIKGIKDLSDAAIDAADQERNLAEITGHSVSDQSQAWLDLHDTITGSEGSLKSFGIAALSIFPELGDGVGSLILRLEGVGPEAEAQYTQMANAATVTLASIKAAHDKYFADLPAAWAATNAKIAAIDKELAESEMTTQDKLDANLQDQLKIKAQMAATNPGSLAYDKETLQLKQDQLGATKLQADLDKQAAADETNAKRLTLEVDKQIIAQDAEALKTKMESMTIEEQIGALLDHKKYLTAQGLSDAISEEQAAVYQNAALQVGYEIAQKQAEVRKATALSEADQLAMYIKETPALQNLNTLTNDGYQLLQLQSKEKQTQYQIDQLVALGVDNLNQKQKDQLTTLIEQSAELNKHIDLTQQAVVAENQLNDAATKVAQTENEIDDELQDEVDTAKGGSGGLPAYSPVITVPGVGSGDQQMQDAASAANAKQSIKSLIDNLQKEISTYNFSDDPTQEALVPALQKKVQDLEQQLSNISSSNPNGTAPVPYTPPTTAAQTQQQLDLLQGIHDAVVPALKSG